MSMCSWTEPGYGFSLYNGKNFEKVKKFLVDNHEVFDPDGVLEVIGAEDESDLNDKLGESAAYKVAEVINSLEKGAFCVKGYQSDGETDQDEMIGIEPQYPWQSEYIPQEKCDEILRKYAEMLGITEEPDFFDAEYYG